MVEDSIDLTEDEYRRLNTIFPRSMQRAKVGERAIELVRADLKKRYPCCSFAAQERGADLNVQHSQGGA